MARSEAYEKKVQELRRGDTDVCEAIDKIESRLATLDGDELYERPGHPGGPETERIPAGYRVAYRRSLEDALALLVQAEGVYLRQREDVREHRRRRLEEAP